ncbi:MAG TPA: helix-turn-helix transcriptional regulator [Verrucomicrobiae bacterium]|nr:helix-turn-helix transcriptional regulator [Verrucomicrobiae bacterium]
MQSDPAFEPHLVINQITLPPASEWVPQTQGWTWILLLKGIGYWQKPDETRELMAGSVVVVGGEFPGVIRSSRLGETLLAYFFVEPENLAGVLSLAEQARLERASTRRPTSVRVLGPDDPIAVRYKSLCQGKSINASLRLQLVQMFLELMETDLYDDAAERPADANDARARLRSLLKQMAASELMDLSLTDLLPKIQCSPRHLSRLFREETGMSFRAKQIELRLTRACHLLSTSADRVIDIALASGFQSGSFFNLTFKNRFGVSPGHWRRQRKRKGPVRQKIVRMLPL